MGEERAYSAYNFWPKSIIEKSQGRNSRQDPQGEPAWHFTVFYTELSLTKELNNSQKNMEEAMEKSDCYLAGRNMNS